MLAGLVFVSLHCTLSLGTEEGSSLILLRLCSCKTILIIINTGTTLPFSMAYTPCEHSFFYLYVVVHEATGISKVRVLGIDVGQLNGNQVVDLRGG